MSTKTLAKHRESLPSIFDDFFRPWNEWFGSSSGPNRVLTVPAVNVSESNEAFELSVAAPGLKKSDFHIDVEGNMLTVSSEKEESKEEKDSRYNRREYMYASFSRSFTLPDAVNAEKISAFYNDGILHVSLPKKEESKRLTISKHIEVK